MESFLPGHFEGSLSQPLQPKLYGHASNVLAKACLFYAKTSLLSSFYYWCYYWWAAHFWRHSLFCCWYIEHFHALKRALEDTIFGRSRNRSLPQPLFSSGLRSRGVSFRHGTSDASSPDQKTGRKNHGEWRSIADLRSAIIPGNHRAAFAWYSFLRTAGGRPKPCVWWPSYSSLSCVAK